MAFSLKIIQHSREKAVTGGKTYTYDNGQLRAVTWADLLKRGCDGRHFLIQHYLKLALGSSGKKSGETPNKLGTRIYLRYAIAIDQNALRVLLVPSIVSFQPFNHHDLKIGHHLQPSVSESQTISGTLFTSFLGFCILILAGN